MHTVFWWETCRKVVPGRLRNRWVDNFKMDLEGITWYVMDLIHLALDRGKW